MKSFVVTAVVGWEEHLNTTRWPCADEAVLYSDRGGGYTAPGMCQIS